MSSIIKLEQIILNKQLLEAEIENLLAEAQNCEIQLSIHIIAGRNLPISIHSKVHRQLKFTIDSQIYETKNVACEGLQQISKWNETHLVPVKSLDSCLKLVYIESETSSRPLGGVIIKLSGFIDQKRHDGWYDIGCGEIRLAIRFIHNTQLFYKDLLRSLSSSILETESQIKKSNCIAQDNTLNFLYSSFRSKIFNDLRQTGKLFSILVNSQASKIQNWFKSLKIQQKTSNLTFKDTRTDAEFGEELDMFLKNIEEDLESNGSKGNEDSGYIEKKDIKDKKIQNQSLNSSEIDIPPYIEASEKVCKRRIAIKRY